MKKGARKIHSINVIGRRSRGRPTKTWHDRVNQILELGVKSQNNRRPSINFLI